MILVYAFSNPWGTNISRLTLLELQKIIENEGPLSRGGRSQSIGTEGFVFRVINSYPQEFFKKYISNDRYNLIIGLGDGMSDKIRIETQAKNAYNNKEIYPFSPIFIDLNLPNVDLHDPNIFSISSNMGTYNCNWIAYSTQLLIDQKKLDTQHLFFHLPKKSNANFVATNIKKLLFDNQII